MATGSVSQRWPIAKPWRQKRIAGGAREIVRLCAGFRGASKIRVTAVLRQRAIY